MDDTLTNKQLATYLRSLSLPLQSSNMVYGRRGNYRATMKNHAIIRDELIHRYAPLFGAISTFIQVAVSREYIVMGRKTPAVRNQKTLMDASFYDAQGLKNNGFQEFLSSILLDWLTLGRGMWTAKRESNGYFTSLRYIDAAYAYPMIKDRRTIWVYDHPVYGLEELEQDDVWFMDSFRMGTSGIPVSPVAKLIPISHLLWLVQEHDMRQLDGRVLTDVIIARGTQVGEAIKKVIKTAIKITIGQPVEDNNVAVIGIDTQGYTGPISDFFHRLGISEIPQGGFSREELEGMLARSIAAVLGLPIGQFWYDPRGTNRSLEQVQQERATLKGPSYAIRTFSRRMNASEIMRGRNTPGRWSIMSFKEETDSSSMALNAQSLQLFTASIAGIQQIMLTAKDLEDKGVDIGIKTEQWLQYFERMNLIPHNALGMSDLIALEENDDGSMRGVAVDPKMITVDSYGRILRV